MVGWTKFLPSSSGHRTTSAEAENHIGQRSVSTNMAQSVREVSGLYNVHIAICSM
jgi:hypothetical protein